MTSPAENEIETVAVQEEPILAQSVLALTEQEHDVGAFTIGMVLASFQDGENIRIPVVDIVLLALVDILKNTPPDFKAALDKMNSAVATLTEKLTAGVDANEALAEFQAVAGISGLVR